MWYVRPAKPQKILSVANNGLFFYLKIVSMANNDLFLYLKILSMANNFLFLYLKIRDFQIKKQVIISHAQMSLLFVCLFVGFDSLCPS